ncbi:DUF6647 family protein [Aquicoccus sp.]|uniref:DUF6647 family protein n=1 Tax=Aquicoccus sp. TaxID=2055851 RepID=UPI0035686F30
MLSVIRILFFAWLMLLVPEGNARAQVIGECAPPAPALVAALIDWIEAEGGYDVTALRADPPAISFCRAGTVIAYEGHDLIVDPDLRAAYDARSNLIYLVEPWHETDPFDRSVLLHELVHAAQIGARDWPCVQAMEWDAYRLQDAWLRLQGIESGFDWFEIWLLSHCPGEVHP